MQPPSLSWLERDLNGIPEQTGALWKVIEDNTGHPVLIDFMAELIRKGGIPSRDPAALARMAQKFSQTKIKYFREQPERWQAPLRTIQWGLGDCFPEGTLVLRDDHELAPIESLLAGDVIWGLSAWTEVKRSWFKGTLPVTAIKLNNGSWLKLTEDHHVTIAFCTRHEKQNQRCNCRPEERELRKISVSELQPGMVMVQPERLPFGLGSEDPDLMLVEGLYISDGWSEENRFFISGKDGHPKEAQKKLVQEICQTRGIETRWHERYIAVNDAAWAQRLSRLGRHAPEKHVSCLRLDEGAAGPLLRGIMADSGANTHGGGRTFTSTSRTLAIQTRVLLRMFGQSAGYSYIENHGGLGKNPIHRLSVRGRQKNREKILRVSAIERSVEELPCYDITTADSYVYLPEHDVTVNQCDDKTILIASMLRSFRIPVRAKFLFWTDPRSNKVVAHVYPEAKLDESRNVWTALESVREVPLGYDPEARLRSQGLDVKVHYVGDK